jgi:acyl-CoA dehydrogenase
MMCKRVSVRSTFGKSLATYSSIRQEIARSQCEIAQARYLTLAAASKIDTGGLKAAKALIAMIKIVVHGMTSKVVDRAIQIHGGLGVCQDTPLPKYWAYARAMRIADGPDEVHMYQLGRNLIKKYGE